MEKRPRTPAEAAKSMLETFLPDSPHSAQEARELGFPNAVQGPLIEESGTQTPEVEHSLSKPRMVVTPTKPEYNKSGEPKIITPARLLTAAVVGTAAIRRLFRNRK